MASLLNIFQYSEGETLIHGLDPRVKYLWVAVVTLLGTTLESPYLLVALFTSTLIPWFLAKIPANRFKGLVWLVALTIPMFVVIQALFYHEYGIEEVVEPTFTIIPKDFPIIGRLTGGIYFYKEGVVYGMIQSFRMMAIITITMLTTLTTRISDLLLGLMKVGLPYDIAFMVVTGIRFVPTTLAEVHTVTNAQKARGLEFRRSFRSAVQTMTLTFTPILIGSVRKGKRLATAAEARAFRAYKKRTFMRDIKMVRGDWVAVGLLLSVAVVGIALLLLGLI